MRMIERLFYEDFERLVNNSIDKLEFALLTSQRLYNKPLYIAFSGGKDSVCLYGLAKKLANKLNKPLNEVATFHYNITNLDPPELVNFVKREYKEVNRREIENCMQFNQIIVNPIIDWSNEDVWLFIQREKLKYCDLYNKGYKRLGCIGCPMGSTKQREKQFEDNPKYKEQFIRTFDKMIKNHPQCNWKNGEECFKWWIQE